MELNGLKPLNPPKRGVFGLLPLLPPNVPNGVEIPLPLKGLLPELEPPGELVAELLAPVAVELALFELG